MQQTSDTTETPSTPVEGPSRRRWPWVVALIATVVLAVGLWLTQPWLLLVDTVADEALPVSIADVDAAPADAAPADANDADGTAAATDDTAAVSSDEPTAAATDSSAAAGDEAGAGEPEAGGANAEDAASAASGPVVLLRGSFISRDHGTTGAVAVVELADGSRVLTIEDLDTDNGPDLFVYLDDDGADAPEDDFDDGRSLGRLRANQGDLVYEIPADVDLADVASVGIWCDRFSSLFGAADLAPPA